MTETTTKSILSSTGKLGLKTILYFILVLFIFVNINLISYISSFYIFKSFETLPYIAWTTAILAIGIIFTVFACYRTYQYLMFDAAGVAYSHATPLVQKVCEFTINNVSNISSKKIKSSHIEKAISVNNSIENVYDSQTPKALKRVFSFLLSQIPFSNLLGNIKDSIKTQDREQAINLMQQQVDNFVFEQVKSNSMIWITWLAPLNILIQIAILYFVK